MPAPQAPPALPATFSKKQTEKAVDALLKHYASVRAEREETELIVKDEHVWLVVNTKHEGKMKKLLPTTIRLPNPPLPPPPATSVCLLTKDPQRKYKDLINEEHKIKFINRVVGVEKLKGKFKPYEARRQLMKEHEVFLCDDAIVGILPKLLGKVFFDAKKQPIPVNLKRKDLKAELSRAISSTYFHPSTGTSNAVRISTPSSHTAAQTLDNVLAALPQVIDKLDGKWDNVLNIGIKTNNSVLLPIWASSMSGRFDKPEVDESKIKSKKGKKSQQSDDDDEMDGSSAPAAKVASKAKGKRPAEDAEEETPSAKAVSSKKVKKDTAVAPTPVPAPTPKKKAAAAPERKKTAGGAGAGKKLKAGVVGKAK